MKRLISIIPKYIGLESKPEMGKKDNTSGNEITTPSVTVRQVRFSNFRERKQSRSPSVWNHRLELTINILGRKSRGDSIKPVPSSITQTTRSINSNSKINRVCISTPTDVYGRAGP